MKKLVARSVLVVMAIGFLGLLIYAVTPEVFFSFMLFFLILMTMVFGVVFLVDWAWKNS